MSGNSVLDTLREIGFLRGIADSYLEQIAIVAERVEFAEGSVIFREGEPAADIFLIVDGHVSLEIYAPGMGRRRILTVESGELLGWSPVLEQTRLLATARAIAATKALKISGTQILTMCEHNPRFGFEFMRRAALALAKRLSATRMQLLDVYGGAMPDIQEKAE